MMRSISIPAMVLIAALACGADAPPESGDAAAINALPKASGTLEGRKVSFPEKGIADGVKATIGLLQSCCSESLYNPDELRKARQGDHIRLVFVRPVRVTVMNEKVEFTQLVFRLPLNTGVFWLRSGDKVRRFSKYQFREEEPFVAWLRQAQPAVRAAVSPR